MSLAHKVLAVNDDLPIRTDQAGFQTVFPRMSVSGTERGA
jgi:hypothetical protein